MSIHVITGNYTGAAMKAMLANPSDREAGIRPIIEGVGGKLLSYYATTGETDFLIIVEADSGADVIAAAMVASASGTVANLKTVRAYTSAQFVEMQKRAGEISPGFRPAGS